MLFEFNDLTPQDEMDLTYLNIPLTNSISNSLYNPKEGFTKGNMFKDLYEPYKNFSAFSISPSNIKEELLLKIYEYDFALNDLNLYLDLNPEDTEMFNLFKKYIKELESFKQKYIREYGPLCLTDVTFSKYNWLNKFPWEKGGSI